MSTFERYLTIWVFLCIIAGVALGHLMPGLFQIIGAAEVAKVNIPVAILIWLMIIPMLLKIDFRSLAQVGTYWRAITGKKGRLITLSATGTPRVPLDPAAGRRVIDQLLAALSRANAG